MNLLLVLTFEAVPSSTLMSSNAMFLNGEGGVSCTLTREVILSLRSAAFKPDQCTRLFIASLALVVSNIDLSMIPVRTGVIDIDLGRKSVCDSCAVR